MDKTFSETVGLAPFDWRKELLAQQDGKGTKNKYWLYKRASAWITCACGNQCAIIPRIDGVPKDSLLRGLGACFYVDIIAEQWSKALTTLDQIESRAAILIAQELQKFNDSKISNNLHDT